MNLAVVVVLIILKYPIILAVLVDFLFLPYSLLFFLFSEEEIVVVVIFRYLQNQSTKMKKRIIIIRRVNGIIFDDGNKIAEKRR